MNVSALLVRAIAMESHFWPDIDKKYIELKIPGMERTGKVISCINELPPKALLRALKLLVIAEHPDGKAFVNDLMHKVFRKEIERFDAMREANNINFWNLYAMDGPDQSFFELVRKAAIFTVLCNSIGHKIEDQEVYEILASEEGYTADLPMADSAKKQADAWMKKWEYPSSLSDINCIEELYTKEYEPYGEVSIGENIPLRAVENYKIGKDEIREIVNVAQSVGAPYNIDRLIVTAVIIKSLAKYAEECKDAYLDMALSPDVATNKIRKTDLKKKEREIDKLQKLVDEKQQLLNSQQLQLDRLNKKLADQDEEMQQLREYSAALEAQLETEDVEADERLEAHELDVTKLKNKKIVVIGGFFSWQQRLKEIYPELTYIDTDDLSFDVNLVRGADLVLFNFLHTSHGLYYRLKANCDNGRIVYIANNNLDYFRKALAKKIN